MYGIAVGTRVGWERWLGIKGASSLGCQWMLLQYKYRCFFFESTFPFRNINVIASTVKLGKHRHDDSHGDDAPVELNGYEVPPPKRAGSGKIIGDSGSTVRSEDSPQACSKDPENNNKQRAQGSGERSEEGCGPKFTGKSLFTLAGIKIPAGVGGRRCRRTADLGRGEC
jgi:hypothetical protein